MKRRLLIAALVLAALLLALYGVVFVRPSRAVASA